jgi:hypothetical protein
VRARVVAAVFALSFLPLTAAPGSAQAPPASSPAALPAPGFMTPQQVTRIVRSAGFDPLAPPLREGSTYVLRVTDFRGILMRVVIDAHSGAIRAVNRIVAGPGPIGPIGMMPPPYGMPPPYAMMPPPYGVMPPYGSAGFERPEMMPSEPSAAPPGLPAAAPAVAHPASPSFPPLPRSRPFELAAGKADAAAPDVSASGKPDAKPAATAAAPVAPNKPAPLPPIND